MRKTLLSVLLCLILTLGLAATTQAAPNLAATEGGTLSLYAESIFGLVYYGGVTFTFADGTGLGIGTMLNEEAFNLYVVNGTLSLGPVALNLQALTDTSFEEYMGEAGVYLRLDLGVLALYPGVGVFFMYYDVDDDGVPEASNGDPYFSAELQFNAGQLTIYADATMPFGGSEAPIIGRFGLSYAF